MNTNNLHQLVHKNQSIKIVPSLEDSLKAIGLNVDLDENTNKWFQQLKTTWKTWKASATLESQILFFFQSITDPFRVSLVFVINTADVKDCKCKSLPYFIMETLQKWSRLYGKVPDDVLKLPAFHIGIQQRSSQFLNLISKVYEIKTICESILPMVSDMIKNDNCKLASQVIIALDLFDDIPVEDLLFPLILQDKINIIDDYLSQCPSQIKKFLEFLDSLLNKKFKLKEYAQRYIEEKKIGHVKFEKIHYKPLGKLVARLCNKFNVPIENCKNLSKNRTTGGLRYLIHQKYQEHNVSSSVWDDLVKDSLRQNADTAPEFIDMLLDYDKNEARKWATYLKMSDSDLPLILREMSIKDEAEEEVWDDEVGHTSQQFYKLSISDESIIMIDTAENFYDLLTILKEHSVISIDCEWKPSFGAKQSQVALIQIATLNKVYLIDTLVLNKQTYSSFWTMFQKTVIDNAEIIKLGFGLEQDLKEMKASVVSLGNISVKGEGLLDMAILWRNLLSSGLVLPSCNDNSGNSLSCLVQSCFSLPLEKSEQCSNWELRPLRKSQIHYAALDAFILIELFNYFQSKCSEQGFNFEEICNDVMTEPKKKPLKKVKGQEKTQTLCNVPLKLANEVKFLVEPQLCHILPYLRYCGIDSVLMSDTMLWYDIINMAISDDRLILLHKYKGTPSTNFPQSSILEVGKGSINNHLSTIFQSFNINIKQNELLRICMKCNERDLRELTPDEVTNICVLYQSQQKINISHSSNVDYDDNDDTNYDNFLSESEDDDMYQVTNVNYPSKPCKMCKTSKGATIEISDVYNLSKSNTQAILCENCGEIFWVGDELTKNVNNTILKLTSLTAW